MVFEGKCISNISFKRLMLAQSQGKLPGTIPGLSIKGSSRVSYCLTSLTNLVKKRERVRRNLYVCFLIVEIQETTYIAFFNIQDQTVGLFKSINLKNALVHLNNSLSNHIIFTPSCKVQVCFHKATTLVCVADRVVGYLPFPSL